LLAAESYPTATRSGLHGLSSGIAKVGAFAGALLVPLLLAAEGLRAVTLLAFGCYIAAIATTLLLPEPRGRALDDVNDSLKLWCARCTACPAGCPPSGEGRR
jgi:hypothetical protein